VPALLPPLDLVWDDVPDTLLALAACDLDEQLPPLPRLVAFHGEEPIALTVLRPLAAPDDLLPAVVELLALVVPLGADRVAVALPLRTERPAPDLDAPGPGDLGLLVGWADATGGPARVLSRIHPLASDEDDGRWWGPGTPLDPEPDGSLLRAVALAIEARDQLHRPDDELRPQLIRVLALGHGVALAPRAAVALDAFAGTPEMN
jgi:hypothetical protein